MQSESQLNIQTPENIAFGYPVADIGSRFQAAVIDTTAIVFLQIVTIIVGLLLGDFADLISASGWVIGIMIALLFILFWGYYIVFELVWNGQTPGKRYVGLRVVDRNGVPVGLAGSLIRNLVRIIDFLPVGYGLGAVAMFANKQALRLGDLASGTLVVRDQHVTLQSLSDLPKLDGLSSESDPLLQELPTYRLAESDVELGYSYLNRRSGLKTERALIRPILQHLYDKMEVELEDQLHYDVAIERLERIVASRRGA